MNDLWSDIEWGDGPSSIEPWELSEAENSRITMVNIQHFLVLMEDNPIRCEERELLFTTRPHFIEAHQDIWNSFFWRIPKLNEGKNFQAEKDAIEKPRSFEMQPFTAPRPVFEDIEKDVVKEASTAVRSSKFWLVKSLRDDYVGEKTYPRYQEALHEWESNKDAFEKQQLADQAEFNETELDKYNATLREIEDREQAYLHPSTQGIQKQIRKDLSEISFPYATSMAFAYSSGNVFIDILYPDREGILSSEFVSAPKTQTEDSSRYLETILSCAFSTAMTVFNASKAVLNIIIVGHSVNYSTGDDNMDSNLYAVCFDRSTFSQDFLVRRYFSPFERLTHYPHIIDVSKRYIISPIQIKRSKGDRYTQYEGMSFTSVAIPPSEPKDPEEVRKLIKLDNRFEEAAKMVLTKQRVSTSDLQRSFGMGVSKASYVLGQLEVAGIVGQQEGDGTRPVYVSSLNELNGIIKSLRI